MKKLAIFLMALGLMVGGSVAAQATLLFDRGLPTANLNTAGANQSNVAWADWEPVNPTGKIERWQAGDDIVITNPGIYQIDTIRVWTTTLSTQLKLTIGNDTFSNYETFSNYVSTPVTYSDKTGYLGNSGTLRQIYQLDFAINKSVTNEKLYFFLGGLWSPDVNSGFTSPYLLASNAAKSGSTQDGADDTFWWLHIAYPGGNLTLTPESWESVDGGGTSGWGPGWDKNSDANVQVFGTQIPEPATMLLFGLGLLGLAGVRRKLKK